MHVYLETERLILRQFTADDVDNLVELDSDPEVMRYVGGTATPRAVLADDHLPYYLEYYEKSDRYGFWAVIEKASGDFLGWFHFRPGEGAGPEEPELGYRLRQTAWGKGYATEGSRALLCKGFSEMGVERVTASAAEANTASWRVMEKVGMTRVRAFLYTGTGEPYDESVEYAITRDEWERQVAETG
jgi:RimJ/RimL family protein N-acetyltransferase